MRAKVISWFNFPPPGTALMTNMRKEDPPHPDGATYVLL